MSGGPSSPRTHPIVKAGYALKRKGERVYSWHRARLVLTEREFIIHVVSERDFLLVGQMLDMISGHYKGDHEYYKYDLEYVQFQFLKFHFTWSVTGKKFGFQFDVLSEDHLAVKKSYTFCFDSEEEQEDWEVAFQKVASNLRNSKNEQLTEANQSRRGSVFNNIRTIMLIAKNMTEEEAVSAAVVNSDATINENGVNGVHALNGFNGHATVDGDGNPEPGPLNNYQGRKSPDIVVSQPYYAVGEKKYSKSYYQVTTPDEDDGEPIEQPYYAAVSAQCDTDNATLYFDSISQREMGDQLGDFNRRFQDAVKAIAVSRRLHIAGQDLIKPYLDLVHLSQDFVHTATTYGKIIISEVYLPADKKKIKPIDMGGYAGGLKFMVQNILFKFAIDHFNLYSSDDAAAKVAGHDLRGLTHYFECGIEDLCVPLTMLLDYRGFRLVCEAVMPISRDTIVYGSSNGGEDVHCTNSNIYEKLCRASKMLNLKPHLCRNSNEFMLVSAIDLEGHVGTDNRYYLCDFSRAFPPERPHPKVKSAYLYRMLRPEFIRGLASPLCSDAHSWFIQNMTLEKEHNREVSQATNYLLNTTIPSFANVLIKLVGEALAKGELPSLRIGPHLHSYGINMRHLGHLISYISKNNHVSTRAAIVVVHMEMATRILKGIIRKKLRTKMREIRLPLEEPYRCLLVDFLNLVFGATQESIDFWETTMKEGFASKFCYTFNPASIPPSPVTRVISSSAPPSPQLVHTPLLNRSSPSLYNSPTFNSPGQPVPHPARRRHDTSVEVNMSHSLSSGLLTTFSSVATHPLSSITPPRDDSFLMSLSPPSHPSSLGPKSTSTPNLGATAAAAAADLVMSPSSPNLGTQFNLPPALVLNSTTNLNSSTSSLNASTGPTTPSSVNSSPRPTSSPNHGHTPTQSPNLRTFNSQIHHLKQALFTGCPGQNGLYLCFVRLLEMTKMKFAPIFLDRFSKDPAKLLCKKKILHETDLLKIGLTTKQLNIVDFAQGFIFKSRGDVYLAEGDKETARYFYALANAKYQEALHANPYNRWTLVNTAEVLTKLIELEIVLEEDAMMIAVNKINKLYMRAINMDQNDSYSLFSYASFLEKHTDNSKIVVEEFYLRSLENDPANCLCLSKYADFLVKNKYPDADQFVKLAQQLSSMLLSAKDLYGTLSRCKLERTGQIWHAKSHKIKPADRNSREFLSSHRARGDSMMNNQEKCIKCGVKFEGKETLTPHGQCAHIGTWHNSFLDCNLDCVVNLSRSFSFGVPHWSCCFSINGTTTVCPRSGPHEGESCITPFLWDEDDCPQETPKPEQIRLD